MREFNFLLRNLSKIFFLILIDLSSFYTCLLLSYNLRKYILPLFLNNLPIFHFTYTHFLSFWWIPCIFIFFIFYEGIYDRNLPFWDETYSIVKSTSLSSVTVMSIVTLGKMGEDISRIVLLGIWILSLFIFPIYRLWGKKILFSFNIFKEPAIIIGAGNAGKLILKGLQREKHMGFNITGFLDDNENIIGKSINGVKVIGKISDYPEIIKNKLITTAIIAIPSLPPDKLSNLTAFIQNNTPNTMLIPDLKGIALLNTALLHLFTEEIFLMNIRNNLKSTTNKLIKISFDFLISIILLPFILPLLLLISIIIKLETKGPAIYAHDRIGKNGKIFKCYKFRTMHKDAEERLRKLLESDEEFRIEWENNWKLKDDPRITRIGRFLRKTSLDELPQILNVIKQEMSLVGPRPYLPREKESIKDNISIICSARPGITGLWQVSGRSNTNYKHRIKLDSWYVINWSLWLDIVILLKTIKVVLKAEGAY